MSLQKFDLIAHIRRQREFSLKTFGPGDRREGITNHIIGEVVEVQMSGGNLQEWVDVMLLALDGAWRAGYTPEQIAEAIISKQAINEMRDWPDWRVMPYDSRIEHVRGDTFSGKDYLAKTAEGRVF